MRFVWNSHTYIFNEWAIVKIIFYLQCTFCIMDKQVNFYSKLKLLNVGVVKNVYKVIEVKPEAEWFIYEQVIN